MSMKIQSNYRRLHIARGSKRVSARQMTVILRQIFTWTAMECGIFGVHDIRFLAGLMYQSIDRHAVAGVKAWLDNPASWHRWQNHAEDTIDMLVEKHIQRREIRRKAKEAPQDFQTVQRGTMANIKGKSNVAV